MASSDRSPKKGKKKEEDGKNWKSNFVRLVTSCGSGKSKDGKQKAGNLNAAPSTPPNEATWTRIDDDANVSKEVVTVNATPGHGVDAEEVEISYSELKEIGQGTFGIVYRARLCETGEVVAIKKTLDDPKFKNRELMMMRQLEHPNVLDLRYFFYTHGIGYKKDERYLNMILDYIPETLFSVAKCDGTYTKPLLDPLYVKIYTYQVFRSLAYLHSLHISHRDVKPQNLLLNPETHAIKLCDFGSAKELSRGDTNVAYICSRYYRAPELVLGATEYTCQIDVWSAGCVLAELFQGHPIFPGANGPDQMVEIIKVLGTPTMDDLASINPRFTEFRFPYLPPHPWEKVFKHQPTPEAADLISRVLVYAPSRRMSPLEACAHPFYDELRRRGTRLKNGKRLPPLFNFKPEELEINPSLNSRLMPDFDEEDPAYLASLAYIEPAQEESPTRSTPLNRLDSLRGSFKKTLQHIPQLKKVGSKKGQKLDKKDEGNSEKTGTVDMVDGVEDGDDRESDYDATPKGEDSAEEAEGVSLSRVEAPDTSVTYPEIHSEPNKKKGKRSKRANNSEAMPVSGGEFVDSFTSSMNQSGLDDNTDTVTADIESLEIKVPKKKKGKRKQKARPEEGDADTTLDDGQDAPFASTPSGRAEKLADSPFSTPTLPSKGDHMTSTSIEMHTDHLDDSELQEPGVIKKTKKKTTKKKTKNTSGDVIEHTEVTETVVVTTKHSTSKESDF